MKKYLCFLRRYLLNKNIERNENMVWLEVKRKDKNLYVLKDKQDRIYNIVLKFLDTDEFPDIGDTICMNEQLLNINYEGYNTFYTFGSLDNKYGKTNITLDDVDIIMLMIGKKEIYLKRLYG